LQVDDNVQRLPGGDQGCRDRVERDRAHREHALAVWVENQLELVAACGAGFTGTAETTIGVLASRPGGDLQWVQAAPPGSGIRRALSVPADALPPPNPTALTTAIATQIATARSTQRSRAAV
jgi:hypothetical protein